MKTVSLQLDNRCLSYMLAVGIDDFKESLNVLLKYARKNPAFAATKHYVLFQLVKENPYKQSLIQVNLSQTPFQFRLKDLNHRAATQAEKKAIAEFLCEHCTEQERRGANFWDWFQRGGIEGVLERAKATVNRMAEPLPEDPLKAAFLDLEKEQSKFVENIGNQDWARPRYYEQSAVY